MKLIHEQGMFYTHQPVLLAALRASTGPVLEMGVGEGSTQLIHDYCTARNRQVLSVEGDYEAAWVKRYTHLQSNLHSFQIVSNWEQFYSQAKQQRWGLVFLDQGPAFIGIECFKNRAEAFKQLRDHADYLVVHDSDALPKHGLLGKEIRAIQNERDPGEYDWSADIKFARQYHPKRWLCHLGGGKQTGPPTLLASNTLPCDIEVDFDCKEVDL